jgi:hypothetical protein
MAAKFDPADLVTPSEAARILGVSKQLVWRWMDRCDLVAVLIGGRRFLRRSTLSRPEPRNSGRKPAGVSQVVTTK